MTARADTALLTVTGPDRPGVTARLFTVLAGYDLAVLDVEQVVIRGRLVLGVETSAPRDPGALSADLAAFAAATGMAVDATLPGGDEPAPPARGRAVHVTVLGHPLLPDAVAGIAGALAGVGANIDRIDRLAAYPVTALELLVSGAASEVLRPALAERAAALGVDVAVEPAGLHRRAKRLLVMDVDSTLVQGEVIEMLAAYAGVGPQVAAVTEQAMRGDLDFEASLRARVALLRGLPASTLDAVRRDLQLTPGARTLVRTLHRLGYRTAIVSGGFSQVTDPLTAELGIAYARANTLEVRDGTLTGALVGPVVDRAAKAAALREFAAAEGVPLSQTVAVGDGANDLDMLAAAGLGVAFNAKPVVRAAAHTAVNVPFLDTVLYLLGISREEVEAADATA